MTILSAHASKQTCTWCQSVKITALQTKAEIFHGEMLNTRDIITFQGDSVAELKKAFIDSVEDYLAFCSENGEEPETHRNAVIAARKSGISLNA